MSTAARQVEWVRTRGRHMARRVEALACTNSGTGHTAGIRRVIESVRPDVERLAGEVSLPTTDPVTIVDECGRTQNVDVGPALLLRKRPEARRRVLLNIHLDTVYAPEHPFQRCEHVDRHTLRGPGVADAKGGLVVMLTALEAFEQSAVAERLGYDVLLNPDEEWGSPGSLRLLHEAAQRNHIGLLFEPSLPDGSLIAERKGSGNFTAVLRGSSAHAGRDFESGRSAVLAAAQLVLLLDDINRSMPGVTVNVGRVVGGGAVNVVPDTAVVRWNVRVERAEQVGPVEQRIANACDAVRQRDGITIELTGGFSAPPKPCDRATATLLDNVKRCGEELGIGIAWRSSGGVCDGNRLAAAGLPNIDTLGPRGGAIHSDREHVLLDSLPERAALAALLLVRLAADELPWPGAAEGKE